jgi:hypothetical protein
MNRRNVLGVTAAGLISFCATNIAWADETVKFRSIMHATSVQSQDIGDVDGHAALIARFSGLASFPDGTVATTYFVSANDYTKGAGTFSVYNNLTFADGSVLWYRTNGTATVNGATSVFNGTVSVLGGKGKWEGAKGDGTITGARLVPLAAGADLYLDLVINIKK